MDSDAILQLGTILGVWAHPDDETWTSAGLMMTAIANGQHVAIVTATRGELGSVDATRWPLATLGQVREAELFSALNLIGVKEHFWLDYHDGSCASVNPAEACSKLEQIINKVHPDTILTFGSDGLTGHSDHKTVGEWVRTVATSSSPRPTVYEATQSQEKYEAVDKKADELLNIFLNTGSPHMLPEADMDICFRLTPDLIKKKITAIGAHTSQYEKLMEYLATGAISPDITTPECFMKANI